MTVVSPVGPLRVGARRSPLARAQAELVAAQLFDLGVSTTFVGITTRGDVDYRELTEIGGTGIFAVAVREALARGEIDVAVHSLKDLPTEPAPGLDIVAIPPREDPRDVLVGARLADLTPGARVGTGAPRRAVQLLDWADQRGLPLEVVPIRGNVDTRIELARTGELAAVVLAGAGLRRLGHLAGVNDPAGHGDDLEVKGLPAELLDLEMMLPAPGQGALGLEVHASLAESARRVLEALDDPTARAESLVERGFLGALQAGCTAPVGARAVVKSVRGMGFDLTLSAVIGKTLGSNGLGPTQERGLVRWRTSGFSPEPADFGTAAGLHALDSLR